MKRIMALLVLGATACLAGQPEQQIKIALKKSEDSVAITSTATSMAISVTSKSGIGGATLTRTGEHWPTGLVIHLKVIGLESFGMNNGIIHFNTSVKSPARMPYWKADKNWERPATPDGTLEITLSRKDDFIEIVVPKEMTDGNPKEIKFGWIDAFRD